MFLVQGLITICTILKPAVGVMNQRQVALSRTRCHLQRFGYLLGLQGGVDMVSDNLA